MTGQCDHAGGFVNRDQAGLVCADCGVRWTALSRLERRAAVRARIATAAPSETVTLLSAGEPPSTNRKCPRCGGEWFHLLHGSGDGSPGQVVLNEDAQGVTRVVGYSGWFVCADTGCGARL